MSFFVCLLYCVFPFLTDEIVNNCTEPSISCFRTEMYTNIDAIHNHIYMQSFTLSTQNYGITIYLKFGLIFLQAHMSYVPFFSRKCHVHLLYYDLHIWLKLSIEMKLLVGK